MNGLFVSIGAGPGIGGSTASRFAREGFDLVLAARDVSKLEPSAQKIRKETGKDIETVALDASDFSAVQQFSERFGPAASILHYNAAAIQKSDVLSDPGWRWAGHRTATIQRRYGWFTSKDTLAAAIGAEHHGRIG